MNDDIDRLKRSCRMLEEIFRISEHVLKDLNSIENMSAVEGDFDALWYHTTVIYNKSSAYLTEIENIKVGLKEDR